MNLTNYYLINAINQQFICKLYWNVKIVLLLNL